MLSFVDVSGDIVLLNCARTIADEMLRDFPQQVQAHLQRWMANKRDYLHA